MSVRCFPTTNNNHSNFVVLSLGSNLGDREYYLDYAIRHLPVTVHSKSDIIGTEPILKSSADPNWYNLYFLNMVVVGDTCLSVLELLSIIWRIEERCGRKKKDRGLWLPRTIDIDILFWNDSIIKTREITVPHSEILNRPFLLSLLAQTIPDYIHPEVGKNMKELFRLFV
ncbi:MAG: 2-amino-4-hydroxy-6- hydroxymethyldihydropteridine pyrophosphokinase [Candidatus Xenolissoclinum pacificiensis L6]|uniref:2-amino-4-hydroxy-6-hydroxymethyldihydropteridine pyrophosphokinase n=1 Tax=Candidatus Xenolissoclinum pacificiensis L6 TaxID=1401685 RepID=W2V0F1_9RICK|nr:MAG: 2-amino-4-hydroxy-6- hydroxymethyldihydropteridine pyrophosphokinase [Candidatus Xenolissoclinum pacificiensis L6]